MPDENTTAEQAVLATIAEWLDDKGFPHDYEDGATEIHILYHGAENMIEISVDGDGRVVVADLEAHWREIDHAALGPAASPTFLASPGDTLEELFNDKW